PDCLDHYRVWPLDLVGDCPFPAEVRIREDAVERHRERHTQERVAEGFIADLVNAVEQRVTAAQRQRVELVAGEISDRWLVGHAASGTLQRDPAWWVAGVARCAPVSELLAALHDPLDELVPVGHVLF